MALIRNAKGRREDQTPSGYTRIFGIAPLGNLMSRVQSAVISSGSELEKLIWDKVRQIPDLDVFLKTTLHSQEDAIYVACKKQIKKSTIIRSKFEPDFLAFHPATRHAYIIEVKDGDQLDTKKAEGERTTLVNFRNDIALALPYSTSIHICGFNATSRDEILHGLKKKFPLEEILTGRELCELFRVSFDDIVAPRASDQAHNLDDFLKDLLRVEDVRKKIDTLLKEL